MSKAVKQKEETKEKEIRLTLPIPESIYNALKITSKEKERSLTKHIIYILKNYNPQEEK